MKTANNAIDLDKLDKFWSRINKEAEALFHDEEGNSLVSIDIRDKTRHERIGGFPVPRMELAETEEDWFEIINRLSDNISCLSERLCQANRIRSLGSYEGESQFFQACSQLSQKLQVAFTMCHQRGKMPTVASNMEWSLAKIGIVWDNLLYNNFNDAMEYVTKVVHAYPEERLFLLSYDLKKPIHVDVFVQRPKQDKSQKREVRYKDGHLFASDHTPEEWAKIHKELQKESADVQERHKTQRASIEELEKRRTNSP